MDPFASLLAPPTEEEAARAAEFEAAFVAAIDKLSALIPEPTNPELSADILTGMIYKVLDMGGQAFVSGEYELASEALAGAIVMLIGVRRAVRALAARQ